MEDKSNPRYDHSCSSCIFLGQHEEYDLYACVSPRGEDEEIQTVIARCSSVSSDYYSGLEAAILFGKEDRTKEFITGTVLFEALRRAILLGYKVNPIYA